MATNVGYPVLNMRSNNGVPSISMLGNSSFGLQPYIEVKDSALSENAYITSQSISFNSATSGSQLSNAFAYIYDVANNSSATIYPWSIGLNYNNSSSVYANTNNASSSLNLSASGLKISQNADVSIGGDIRTYGANNSLNCFMASLNGYPNNGYVGVGNSSSAIQAGIYVNATGQGIVFGNTKSFVVDYPKDSTKNIWYACIEGPEAAMYERGTAKLSNGKATIKLSETFRLLASSKNLTVILTPLSANSKGIAVVEKSIHDFSVQELFNGNGSYEFDWEIKAVRKEHEDWKVIRDKSELIPNLPSQPEGEIKHPIQHKR